MKGYVMRMLVIAVALLAVGCASQQMSWTPEDAARAAELNAQAAAAREAPARAARAAAEAALTPMQRAQRDLDIMKAVREYELLQRALSGSPDYSAALTRAATVNVDDQASLPEQVGARRTVLTPRAREAAIRTEEARLSDAVELRRRQRLNEQAAVARSQQDQQAAAICRARGNVAGSQPAFGGFGIGGAIAAGMQQGWAAANAEAACFNAYRQTGIMPAL